MNKEVLEGYDYGMELIASLTLRMLQEGRSEEFIEGFAKSVGEWYNFVEHGKSPTWFN